ncbi:heme ABC exporter ATP-binding protein CcmA [Marinivivus vitaminiproducens]|uniref:heme ABC exporter ATP-binding protein CcmA n=1 Tax=Marinivivus vitaminiproducens TaxID=3035935 RepID=UPI00279849CA|nr:heme ABC exporter ATP-binding protein CcmA [Geminicoccaceae bacterium SCSIO 64248]
MLEVADLACDRAGRRVFEAVAFRLEPGQLLVLRGANGSGKSSLLRVLGGLVPASAGTIRLSDEAVPGLIGRCHYVGHAEPVKPRLTVRETLAFLARVDGAAPERVDAALAGFGLDGLAGQRGQLLSAGQKRRAALARLLLGERSVWLLDEPEVGLDEQSRSRLAGHVQGHLATGGVAVVASHLPLPIAGALVLDFGA